MQNQKKVRILSKYPNRRIYDTHDSVYVSFADIKKLLISDIELKILDSKNQLDVTRNVLIQMIAEDISQWSLIFSEDMLKNIILINSNASKYFFGQYLENALKAFTNGFDLENKIENR